MSDAVAATERGRARRGAADRVPARAMVWVAWRQHRAAVATLLVAAVCLAVAMLLIGLKGRAAVASCGRSSLCLTGTSSMFDTSPFDNYATGGYLLLLIPVLTGMFLGAPLLAAEFERGTFRFAWTQQLGARRWTALKLALLGTATVVVNCLLGLLYTWSYQPWVRVGLASRWVGGDFGVAGPALAGWTLLGLATGVLTGLLLKRIVTAMAVTAAVLATLTGAMVVAGTKYMLDLATLSTPVSPQDMLYIGGFAQGTINTYAPPWSGRIAGDWIVRDWYTGPAPPQAASPAAQQRWLTSHHEALMAAYQPVSRFWLFQGGFTLVLAALAVIIAATAVYLVSRRAA